MAKRYGKIIKLNYKPYVAIDVGCPDFDRARENRKMVKEHRNLEAYLQEENRLGRWRRVTPIVVEVLPLESLWEDTTELASRVEIGS